MKFGTSVKFVKAQFVSEGGPVARILGPEDIANIYKRDIATRPEYDCEVEQFSAMYLDTRNNCKAAAVVTKGTLNASLVHAREVFRPAIACGAAAIAVCHNHPSGETSPSPEDLQVTRDLIAAGKILGIKVLDHVKHK